MNELMCLNASVKQTQKHITLLVSSVRLCRVMLCKLIHGIYTSYVPSV